MQAYHGEMVELKNLLNQKKIHFQFEKIYSFCQMFFPLTPIPDFGRTAPLPIEPNPLHYYREPFLYPIPRRQYGIPISMEAPFIQKCEVFTKAGVEFTDAVTLDNNYRILIGYSNYNDVGLWLFHVDYHQLKRVCRLPKETYGNRLSYSRKEGILLVWTKGLNHINEYIVEMTNPVVLSFVRTLYLPDNLNTLQIRENEDKKDQVRFLFDSFSHENHATYAKTFVYFTCFPLITNELGLLELKSELYRSLAKKDGFCSNCILKLTYPFQCAKQQQPPVINTQILSSLYYNDPYHTKSHQSFDDTRLVLLSCPYTVVIYSEINVVEVYGRNGELLRRTLVNLFNKISDSTFQYIKVCDRTKVYLTTLKEFVIIP